MILQPSHAEAQLPPRSLGPERFPEMFRTEPGGPINHHVVREDDLRKLATEIVRYSPDLARSLMAAGR